MLLRYRVWHAYRCFVGPKKNGYSFSFRVKHSIAEFFGDGCAAKALWLREFKGREAFEEYWDQVCAKRKEE